jgi:hypothetical protein
MYGGEKEESVHVVASVHQLSSTIHKSIYICRVIRLLHHAIFGQLLLPEEVN